MLDFFYALYMKIERIPLSRPLYQIGNWCQQTSIEHSWQWGHHIQFVRVCTSCCSCWNQMQGIYIVYHKVFSIILKAIPRNGYLNRNRYLNWNGFKWYVNVKCKCRWYEIKHSKWNWQSHKYKESAYFKYTLYFFLSEWYENFLVILSFLLHKCGNKCMLHVQLLGKYIIFRC